MNVDATVFLVKTELYLCLIKHHAVQYSAMYSLELRGQLHSPVALSPEKSTRNSLDRSLGGFQSRQSKLPALVENRIRDVRPETRPQPDLFRHQSI
jgi:hypothetical protein